jgi:hypothetical protein
MAQVALWGAWRPRRLYHVVAARASAGALARPHRANLCDVQQPLAGGIGERRPACPCPADPRGGTNAGSWGTAAPRDVGCQTTLLLDLWSGKPLIPTLFYYDLRLQRCPHEGQLVWLGAYRDWQAALAWYDGLHVGISADEPPNAFVCTFTAFRVVFQVAGAFDRGITFNDGRLLAAALTRVWPPSGRPADWPPKKLAFGDESLAELARSVKG